MVVQTKERTAIMGQKLVYMKKPPLLFYIVAGMTVLVAMFAAALYLMHDLERGVFSWWVYLPLTAYMMLFFTVEQALFGKRRG